jgi:hypothetical protein
MVLFLPLLGAHQRPRRPCPVAVGLRESVANFFGATLEQKQNPSVLAPDLFDNVLGLGLQKSEPISEAPIFSYPNERLDLMSLQPQSVKLIENSISVAPRFLRAALRGCAALVLNGRRPV